MNETTKTNGKLGESICLPTLAELNAGLSENEKPLTLEEWAEKAGEWLKKGWKPCDQTKTITLLAALALISGCAATTPQPVTQTARMPFLTSLITVPDDDTPVRSPHDFHTTYYDKDGSTHDVITEVDAEGNQKVMQDNILVIGSGHEE